MPAKKNQDDRPSEEGAQPIAEPGIVEIPLDRLKPSPHNARRTPHSEAAIEALAASIHAKGMLQNLVVTPEQNARGQATGRYLVTAGEGRRRAQLLRAKRRQIPKDAPIRCLVDATHDPLELSLDENVTRSAMHPADQFEAFARLSAEQGWGAEEIAARFGVTAHVVRQRLRLAAVSPRLVQAYRDGELTLEQLMAFAISDDHARQEQVYDQLSWNRDPRIIRRDLMETHVPPQDRRVIFVGIDAYVAAGGAVVRDLFSEEDGGYCEDPLLLDRLALERLQALAAEVRAEGWRWAEASLDFPHGHGLRRVYPRAVPLPPDVEERIQGLQLEVDALIEPYEVDEDLPDVTVERIEAIEAEIDALNAGRTAYDPDTIARAGVFVSLGQDGEPRIERGFIRPEDEPTPAAIVAADAGTAGEADGGDAPGGEARGAGDAGGGGPADEPEASDGRRLSDALVRDLTAHRTLGLRIALGEQPDVALIALTHALAAQTFYPAYAMASCLDLRVTSASLTGHAEGIEETPAAQALAARHARWAALMPPEVADLWDAVAALDAGDRAGLLAHCAALSLSAVQQRGDSRPPALAAADRIAQAVALDMTRHWTPTVRSYLGRVTRAQIEEAVRDGVSEEAAAPLAGTKKQAMAEAAEQALADRGWLPALLRTAQVPEPSEQEAPLADAA